MQVKPRKRGQLADWTFEMVFHTLHVISLKHICEDYLDSNQIKKDAKIKIFFRESTNFSSYTEVRQF